MLVSIFPGILTFVLTVVGIPAFIRFYHKAQITGQQMHEDVKQHQAKAGTPTMGGLVFLLAGVLVSLVLALVTNQLTNNVGMILFIMVLYGWSVSWMISSRFSVKSTKDLILNRSSCFSWSEELSSISSMKEEEIS